MTTTETPDTLLDTNEAAARMGVAANTLVWWRWAKWHDQPPHVRVGRRGVRYRASDVAAWIASRKPQVKSRKPQS